MPGRVPHDIPTAVAFVIRTDNFFQAGVLPTNGNRLGVNPTLVADWAAKRIIIEECYLKWSDPIQKTKPINILMVDLLKEFTTFAIPVLDTIAAITDILTTDEAIFNLVADNHHKAPAHRESIIIEACHATIKRIGNGEVVNHVKPDPASKRDHIFEGSTGFECAYSITDTPTTLTHPSAATSKSFTKAAVVMFLGEGNKGKFMNHCERWVYGPNPNFNGPYSTSQSDLID